MAALIEKSDLLIEIGTEELPAGSVLPMASWLAEQLDKVLQDAGLEPGETSVFATPRRIAARTADVLPRQSDTDVQKRGPAIAAAFDDNDEPTKALLGFARSCNAAVESLERLSTDKGVWMVFNTRKSGESVEKIIADALPKLLKQMPMPKRMRWSNGSTEFLRPVEWLLALYGRDVIPVEALGLTSSRQSKGHRFHAPDFFEVDDAGEYEAMLYTRQVIASFDARRSLIAEQVEAAAEAAGGRVNMSRELLDEVTALVEWPVAISGSFDVEYLTLPKEALIQTMEENQRYFALFDQAGDLMPGFVTIANIESNNPATIRIGNERVIRPRFKDTMFFWENDRKRKLIDFRDDLKKVLFQKKLGTVFEKTERIEKLAQYLSPVVNANGTQTNMAAKLSRCDLVTDIVTELAKMQGIAGRYYAQLEGYDQDVCDALEQQYWPKQAGGDLPQSRTGLVLAIAEKTDTLTGIFGIGQKPTGAKDPFGLRRAALGLLRSLIERKIDLDLLDLFGQARDAYGSKLESTFDLSELVAYALDRLRGYYTDQGVAVDAIDAVLATGITNPLDIDQRIHAIAQFRTTDAAESLAAANKRIRNILKKVDGPVPDAVDSSLLSEAAERSLVASLEKVRIEIEPLYEIGNYHEAMSSTSKLREPVDSFFNDVMVMVDDPAIRDNRLALLKQVGDLCSRTADLSRLQIEAST